MTGVRALAVYPRRLEGMRYELRRHEDDAVSLSFTAVDEKYALQRRRLEPGAEFVWAVEAGTHNEALARYHEFMGREPYKPMDDD